MPDTDTDPLGNRKSKPVPKLDGAAEFEQQRKDIFDAIAVLAELLVGWKCDRGAFYKLEKLGEVLEAAKTARYDPAIH